MSKVGCCTISKFKVLVQKIKASLSLSAFNLYYPIIFLQHSIRPQASEFGQQPHSRPVLASKNKLQNCIYIIRKVSLNHTYVHVDKMYMYLYNSQAFFLSISSGMTSHIILFQVSSVLDLCLLIPVIY